MSSICIRKLFLHFSLWILIITILPANIFATPTPYNPQDIDLSVNDKPEGREIKIGNELQRNLETSSEDEVTILINLNGDYNEFSTILKQHGFKTHRTYLNLAQGQADPDDVEKIADLPFVNFVQEPIRPVYFDTVSEGVNILQANIAHSIEQTGRGAKVAVIDSGFDITNPEISANIAEAKSFRLDGSIRGDAPAHGTACAEIIVDMAPDVELYLFTAEYSLDFIDAVNYAVSKDVDILSISIGYHNVGPYDGTSSVSRVLEDARNSGVLPVVAVGNNAQKHWRGVFQDFDSDDWLNFAGSDETNSFSLRQDETVTIYLSWNDWQYSDQDYDLYLYRESGTSLVEVARSENTQSGSRSPTETITYTADADGTYSIAIYRYNASGSAEFDLFIYRGNSLEYQVPSGSLGNVADANGAIAVGAINWQTLSLEPFSSRGPTLDGRIKPDIVAPDGVRTTAYVGSFFGTSASAPHVAGLAALLVGSSPSITADEIVGVLEKTAVDMGESGKDNLYGFGRAETEYSTLDVSPRIVSIMVDGKEFPPSVLPRRFLVDGELHTVSLSTTSVAETDTRYAFKRWSDGITSPTMSILFDGSWDTKLARFEIQYLLTIKNGYGRSTGGGWYDPGVKASFSISPTIYHGNGTRRLFTSWTGAVNTTILSTTVLMDSPKVVTALWRKQYELTILSSNLATTGQGWYDAGAIAEFSAQSTIDYGNDTRRAFRFWAGDFSGNKTSGSILMDSPKILEAIWRTQYLIRIDAPPQAGFEGGEWFDAGEVASLSVRNVWNLESNRSRINLKSYILDGEVIQIPRSGSGNSTIDLEIDLPHTIKITGIQQYYFKIQGGSNLQFGTPSPTGDMWWDEGQSTTVSTEYVWGVVDGRARLNLVAYLLDGRRFEVARANSSFYTTPEIMITGPRSLSFEAVTQYLLQVVGGRQVEVTPSPTFDHWFDAGSVVTVFSPVIWEADQAGVRERLDQWRLDDGAVQAVSLSESGRLQIDSIVMDGFHEVWFSYITQYLLEVSSPLNTPLGGGWYDEGTTATIDISPVLEYANQTRHVFTFWIGDVSEGEAPRTSIIMDSPKKVEAEWKTQYLLTVQSIIGGAEGDGWYDRGERAFFRAMTPIEWSNGTRHIFVGWTGDTQTTSPEGSIVMLLPSLVEANWKPQYFLKVVSAYGNPQGEGWYDRGSSASFTIHTPVDWGNHTRHVFTGWFGDVEVNTPEGSILMTFPRTVTATWKTQYTTSLIFTDADRRREIKPSFVEIVDETGRAILLRDYEEVWFDRGDYSINKVYWMGVDVKNQEASTFTVSRPAEIRFPTETYSLRLFVRDPLSLPIQDAKAVIELANGTSTISRTGGDGVVEYPLIPLGTYSVSVEALGLKLQQKGDAALLPEVTITLPLSLPLIILIIVVTASSLSVFFLIKRRSSGWHLEKR